MNTTNPRLLYSVEPNSERFIRWLRETSATAVRFYWELFISLPVTIIAMLLAVIAIVVGIMDIVQHPSPFWSDLLPIGVSFAFLMFSRVRAFLWALLGCFILWVVLVALLLLPIVGTDYRAVTTTAKIVLGMTYCLPPFLAAIYIDYARHRKA
jgi:hypothetical protein